MERRLFAKQFDLKYKSPLVNSVLQQERVHKRGEVKCMKVNLRLSCLVTFIKREGGISRALLAGPSAQFLPGRFFFFFFFFSKNFSRVRKILFFFFSFSEKKIFFS